MRRKKLFKTSASIAAKLLGTANSKDQERVEKWLKEGKENRELFEKLSDSDHQSAYQEGINKYDAEKAWERIEYRLVQSPQKSFHWQRAYSYAAAILLLIGLTFSLNYLIYDRDLLTKDQEITLLASNASLTLSTGEVIDLTKDTTVVTESIELLVDKESQTITYKSTPKERKKGRKPLYNVIKTEVGKEYKIVLPEGSTAHLNSGSTLRFPESFSENSREVEADGEILFNVVPDSERTFTVKSREVVVEVLGTCFNINSYSDNNSVVTTLISGSLRVTSYDASVVVEPNQQVIYDKESNTMKVESVDASIYAAWSEGAIIFKDERLENIVKQLSRWYDFDYRFLDEEVKEVMMGINIDRHPHFSNLYSTLKNIDLFEVEQRGKTLLFSSKR